MTISATDLKKIQKLEDALYKLRSGEERYYSITKLSSIKSLCVNESTRHDYCCYLFDCMQNHLETKLLETNSPTEQQKYDLELVQEIAPVINDIREGKTDVERLRHYYTQLHAQAHYEKIKRTTVRIFKSTELLVIEYLIGCLVTTGEYALKMVYQAARLYVEQYDPSVGTGLIVKSIPMLEDLLWFWRRMY